MDQLLTHFGGEGLRLPLESILMAVHSGARMGPVPYDLLSVKDA
jgi:hypothetical protein